MPTVIVAAAVVRREGRVLLTRRPERGHLPGHWEFPGGKLEEGEAPEEAVRRECREECGIEVEPLDVLDVAFHRYASRDVLLVFYDCRLVDGEVQHLQVADHVWVEPSELRRYDLPPPDQRLVRKLEAGR